MNLLDIIILPLLIIFGYYLKSIVNFSNKYDIKIINRLYFYHLFFGFLFFLYIMASPGDAYRYWVEPKGLSWSELIEGLSSVNNKTYFLFVFNYIPSNVFDLSFFTGCMIYSLIGYLGFIYLYKTITEIIPDHHLLRHVKLLGLRIFPSIFFLPNLHFWSAGVGKDTLLFLCVCILIYGALKPKKRFLLIAIGAFISITLRPHVTFLLMAGLLIGVLTGYKANIFVKIILIGIVGFITQNLFETSLKNITKIDIFTVENFLKYSEYKSGVLAAEAQSGIDMSEYSYPLKVATFLYRPLFFDSHNISAFIASIENVIYIFISIAFIRKTGYRLLTKGNYIEKAAFYYFSLSAIAYAPIFGNLGIIVREKNMLMPAFILFILAGYYHKLQTKLNYRIQLSS